MAKKKGDKAWGGEREAGSGGLISSVILFCGLEDIHIYTHISYALHLGFLERYETWLCYVMNVHFA